MHLKLGFPVYGHCQQLSGSRFFPLADFGSMHLNMWFTWGEPYSECSYRWDIDRHFPRFVVNLLDISCFSWLEIRIVLAQGILSWEIRNRLVRHVKKEGIADSCFSRRSEEQRDLAEIISGNVLSDLRRDLRNCSKRDDKLMSAISRCDFISPA